MTTQANPHTERRELRRVQDGRMIGGVAAGIAEYFGTDVLVIRVAFVAATLIGGVGVVLYVLALLLMPRADGGQAIVRAPRRAGVASALALGLLALGGSILIGAVDLLGTGTLGVAAYLVALGLAGLWWRDNVAQAPTAVPPPTPTRPHHENPYPKAAAPVAAAPAPVRDRSWTLPTLSLALVVAGVLALLNALDVTSIGVGGILAAALWVVGVGLMVSAFGGRGGGLIPVGITLAVVVAALASAGTSFSGGFGEREWAPAGAGELPESFELGAGDAQLDLQNLALPDGTTAVRVEIGAGNLQVDLPDEVNLDVEAQVGVGNLEIDIGGERVSDAGFGRDIARRHAIPGATSTLVLDVDLGFGNVVIEDQDRE